MTATPSPGPSPSEILAAARTRLSARGAGAWERASVFAAARLGSPHLRSSARLGATFARVATDVLDRRRFQLAPPNGVPGAHPAMLLPWPMLEEAEDLVAISLAPSSGRFWRLTCKAFGWSAGIDFDQWPGPRLGLRQDVRSWATELVRWRACAVAPDKHPNPPPAGMLVLDPSMIDWTRRGWLAGVDVVEILDAPAAGPLGRALRRLNPTIGSTRGVWLAGTENRSPRRAHVAGDDA